MDIIQNVLLLVFLILCSAFFSSSESSFMSLSKISIRQMIKEKHKNAKLIFKLKEKKELLLSTILVGNNFVNNFASSIATAFAISLFGESGIGLATFVMTILIITFGEIIPKTLAIYKPKGFACLFSKPLYIIEIILYPVSIIFSSITRLVSGFVAKAFPDKTPIVTEEELKTLIEVGTQEGTLETSEKELMHKIFEFTDLHVRNIMTNRSLIKALPINSSFEETVALFNACGRSRVPIYGENIDDICGVVHYKEVLFFQKDKDFSLAKIMQKPIFVPESMSAVSLLHLLKKEKSNFAVAVDEHGCNSGIITMDDLLAAVFGRISGESRIVELPPEDRISILNQNEFKVPGDISLNDFNAIFKCDLESEYYQTLAGWMLEQFGVLPGVGDLLRTEKASFIVEQQFQRCIKLVRVKFN